MERDFDKYIKLEHYLNRYKFKQISIGGTLADQYRLLQINGSPKFFKISILYIYELFSFYVNLLKPTKLFINKEIIATHSINKPHINNMINPIKEHFSDRLVLIHNPEIVHHNSDIFLIPLKKTFHTPCEDILSISLWHFHFQIMFFLKRKRLRLSFSESFFIILKVLHQIRIISFYDYQFKNSKKRPAVIVTTFDRNSIASPLILTGKKFGISTVTLVHGVINDYGYTPVLADYIYCHGIIQYNQLIDLKVPAKKIRITGTSIIRELGETDYEISKCIGEFKICIGIDAALSWQNIDFLITETIKACSQFENSELIIKLHPSQDKEIFNHYEQLSSKVKVLASSEIDNLALFKQTNLLIVNNSGLGIEAALNEVPVAIFKLPGIDLNMGKVMIESAGCPLITSSDDLKKLVSKMINDKDYVKELRSAGKAFARKYYYATGKTASGIIIQYLEQLLKHTNK
jgi:hypothetical protein